MSKQPVSKSAELAVLRFLHKEVDPVNVALICREVFDGQHQAAVSILMNSLIKRRLVTHGERGGYLISQGGVTYLAENIDQEKEV